MKRYVLTGGPGTGKSSILLSLEMKGEHIIREAAEDYIKLRQAQGQLAPWIEPDFQDKILELQVLRESRIPKGIERVFIDRGRPDGLAYATELTPTYKRIILESEKIRYDKIFLIETLSTTCKTAVRREDLDESLRIAEKLEKIYTKMGYEITRIKPGPLEYRVAELKLHLD